MGASLLALAKSIYYISYFHIHKHHKKIIMAIYKRSALGNEPSQL